MQQCDYAYHIVILILVKISTYTVQYMIYYILLYHVYSMYSETY